MIGPKKAATLAVPVDCTANRTTSINTVRGTMYGSKAGVATFRPSMADSTDKAGVIMELP